jgi:uncharacterized protein (TIGR02145 family)
MKHLLTLALLVCFGTFAHAQIPSYVPTNGLVGWWPFNGNANDESGNGNHGTVNGATLAADRFGRSNAAFSFNGANNKIVIQNTLLSNSFSSHTTAIWINTSSHTDQMLYTDRGIGSYWYKNSSAISSSSGFWNHASHNNNCVNGVATNAQHQPVWDGVWHHLVSVFDAQTLTIKLYQDGVLKVTQQNISANCYGNVSQPTTLGCVSGGGYPDAAFLNGRIDEFAVWNRVLTAAEVQQLYLSNCTPTFTAQPQNTSVGQGQTTTFAVQVDTTSTFQWQMNLGLGAGWVNIPQSSLFSGDTTATLSVQGRNPLDGAQFRCIATACQSDTSNAATLTVTSNSSTLGGVAGVPGKINYQGAAVDSLGKPMKNQTIALQLSVLDSSSTGAAVYVETHSTPTNGSGLFSLQIGGGTAVSGTFDSIPWANGRNKYLKTEVQQNGTWVNLGTSQLVSVPYALHAGSAENAKNANYATFFKDSLGNAYQIKTVNGQPTLVSAPGNNPTPGTFACGQAVTYAGESYPTVQIGTQCWFQKNVNVGTMVQGTNNQANNGILEKYCYNNDTANCTIYGGLYQWAEAVQYQNGASNTTSPSPAFTGNIKGICPNGWHVPSDGEWCTLTTFLDANGTICTGFGVSSNTVGGALKSTSLLWASPNVGATNSSSFSALPSGSRYPSGVFYDLGIYTPIWSSSDSLSNIGIFWNLNYNYSYIIRNSNSKTYGFSVRCIKD